MAISTAGKAKIRSEVRDSASSTQPPRAAAQAPSATPRPTCRCATAISPTVIEVCAPTMMRESTSRPRWSVPSRCCADDGSSLERICSSSTG